MRKTKKSVVELNNAGMTLVEILIAIAILSVAIIPLLFAFVNAMRYNARGRELQQTTVLAHTIIENCKSDTYDEVKAALNDGSFVSGGYTLHKDGNTFYLQGVTLENQKYDVKLDFTAHSFGGQYSYDILNSTTMNPYLDAMLTVNTHIDPLDATSITPAEIDTEAYIKALEDIALGIKEDSKDNTVLKSQNIEVDLTPSYILETFETGGSHAGRFGITKKTEINIFKDASGNDAVTVTYTYSYRVSGGKYKYQYKDVALGIDQTLEYDAQATDYETYTYTIYSNSETKGAGAKLENVYIMYYPAYTKESIVPVLYPFITDSYGVVEEITINNSIGTATDPRTVNVYLVKQKNTNYTDTSLVTLENAYANAVKVIGNTATGSETNVYHNINYNLGNDSWISGWLASTWSDVTVKPSMIVKDTKTLMYDFNVEIYKSGAIMVSGTTPSIASNAQLILAMDGTDLNW